MSNDQNTSFEVDKKMIAKVDDLKLNNPSAFQSLMDNVKSYSSLIKETGLLSKSIQATSIKLWGLLIKTPNKLVKWFMMRFAELTEIKSWLYLNTTLRSSFSKINLK